MKAWLECLLGKRAAILGLAGARGTFAAGLWLLLAAGLAREYDALFLPLEPWRLLVPAAVSTAMGALLWSVFFRSVRNGPDAVSLRSFLSVFWMSAPLAWLYGIPYERFLSPLAALHANLWTLAFVSLWRVGWVTRVIAVLSGKRIMPTLARVLLCADMVVFVVAYLAPRPVFEFMGGTRGSPLEQELGNTNESLLLLSGLAFPILGLILFLFAIQTALAGTSAPDGPRTALAESPDTRSPDLMRFAKVAVLAWLLLAVLAQPEQFRRWSVERDLRAGRISQALAAMSARPADDFPPYWDPPPHPIFEDDEPSTESVFDAMSQQPVAPWVAVRFVPKIFQGFYGEDDTPASRLFGRAASWAEELGEEEARRRLEFIASHAGELTPEQRQAVADLLTQVRAGLRLDVPEEEEQ